MNNFGTLYYYEVKKILSRKLVWSVFFYKCMLHCHVYMCRFDGKVLCGRRGG